ncbi:UD11 glucuronosyltransferase, partial [Anhinga rufa]|nr:UD11 glucuronosyltransferase [Anhinga rufa]
LQIDGSPWLSIQEVLDGLRQKGHEIVVVAPEVSLHVKPTENFVLKTYPVSYTLEEMDENLQVFSKVVFEEGSFLERFLKLYKGIKRLTNLTMSSCTHLLYNKELVRYLEESKF